MKVKHTRLHKKIYVTQGTFILIWSTFTWSMQLLFCYHSRTFLLAKLLASALPLSYKMSDGGSDTRAQIPVQYYYVFGYYRLMDLFLVLNIDIMFAKFETELFTSIYSIVYQNIFYSAHCLHEVWTSRIIYMLPRVARAWLYISSWNLLSQYNEKLFISHYLN